MLTPSETRDQYPIWKMIALPNPVTARDTPETNIIDDSKNIWNGVVIFLCDTPPENFLKTLLDVSETGELRPKCHTCQANARFMANESRIQLHFNTRPPNNI